MKPVRPTVIAAIVWTLVLAAVLAAASAPMQGPGVQRNFPKELANKTTGTYVVAVVGDVLMQDPFGMGRQVSAELQKSLREANTAIAGIEAYSGDRVGWIPSRPIKLLAQEAADLGFDLIAPGEAPLAEPLIGAGVGVAAVACQPALQYLSSGRVALIQGADPLRPSNDKIVTREQLQQLKAIRDSIVARRTEPDVSRPIATPADEPDRVTIFANTYVAGANAGETRLDLNAATRQANVSAVRATKEHADFTVFSMRPSRDPQVHFVQSHEPSQHLRDLAHELIDNGMDMYVGLGQHLMQGIEIYKGRPVFYGLGDVSVHRVGATEPPVSSLAAFLATSKYQDGMLQEIRIYPIDLGINRAERPASSLGVAMTPSRETASAILADLQRYSQPFGTSIVVENGVGVIRVSRDATKAIGETVRSFGAPPEPGCGAAGGRGGRGGRGRGGN